jgi:hypothetical protein
MVWFRERYNDRQTVAADAQGLINCASPIDSFMRHRRLDARTRRDWGDLRLDLDQLARYYKVSWRSDAWINSRRAGQGGCREFSDRRSSSRSSVQ